MARPIDGLRFDSSLLARPPLGAWDVETTLAHFAIVTWSVPAERVRPLVHPAFALDTVDGPGGQPHVWVSAVPFEDQDFRFSGLGWPRLRFGQTNYRTYVIDPATGEHLAWFFGTSLDSWSVSVPRLAWRLPWHRGRIRFDCDYDPGSARYQRYRMNTASRWAPVSMELRDSGEPVSALAGAIDLESALVILTHPLRGVFYRSDGKLGSYSVWHDRLRCTSANLASARFGLLDRLGVVPYAEQANAHSVLVQPRTTFTIYLPPRIWQGIE